MFSTLLSCLGLLFFGIAAATPTLFARDQTPASLSRSDFEFELGKSLSNKAALYFPGESEFTNLTARWADNVTPDFAVSVLVGTEQDVSITVKFARKHNLDFLAISRGHGTTSKLSTVKKGIQIHLRQLHNITIAQDGNSATLGGGVYNDEIVNALDAAGKASGSGSEGCVGLMGAGLGGGIGRYQGSYGLVLDNIIDMDVVLADGTSVFVSNTSNPDLYWAMRGAGHNFGIVTKLNYKIYDAISPTWYLSIITFRGDQVKPVFKQLNRLIDDGKMPAKVLNYAIFAHNPDVNSTEPLLYVFVHYIGKADEAVPYVKPFWDLGPTSVTNFTGSYPDLFYAAGSGLYQPVCDVPGPPSYLFSVGLKTYNVDAISQLWTLYSEKVKQNPAFGLSEVLLEAYSLEAVRAVDPASTAFPHRGDNLNIGFLPRWTEASGLENEAYTWSKEAIALLEAGQVPQRRQSTYVNYAFGDEPLEALYGWEPWRLERLRGLKKKYDPDFKFKFYNPIQ